MIRLAAIDTIIPAKMDAALMYIHSQFGYSVESIFRELVVQSHVDLGEYPNTFPYTISDYYWIQEGEARVRPWVAIGKLKTGVYFYYVANCNDPSGRFYLNKKATGIMHLWISHRYSDLINWAMDADVYKKYLSETSATILLEGVARMETSDASQSEKSDQM